MFDETIEEKWRTVKTSYGLGDFEVTIPLGSWRKGGGLAGKRGHVYSCGKGWAGVWLNGGQLKSRIAALTADFPNLKVMQVGDGEMTFRVPTSDLGRLLPALGAKRRFVTSDAKKTALAKARMLSPLSFAHEAKPISQLGLMQ